LTASAGLNACFDRTAAACALKFWIRAVKSLIVGRTRWHVLLVLQPRIYVVVAMALQMVPNVQRRLRAFRFDDGPPATA
jgi:hypothetical protein